MTPRYVPAPASPRRKFTALPRPVRDLVASARAVVRAGVDLALPEICPGCGAGGRWCESCAAELSGLPRTVMVPPSSVDRVAAAGLPMPGVYALGRYRGAARAAIIAGKDHGQRYLPTALGRGLASGLVALQQVGALPKDMWLVPAPTRRAAARARGGDPVLAMARAAAADLAAAGRPVGVAPCLFSSRRVRDSVGLDAAGRAANLVGNIRFDPRRGPPADAAVVLIDDVFTTGATTVASYLALAERHLVINSVVVLAAAAPLRPTIVREGARHVTSARPLAVSADGTR